MQIWKVKYFRMPSDVMKPESLYVKAYTQQEAKELAYQQLTREVYSTNQQVIAFISIEMFAEF